MARGDPPGYENRERTTDGAGRRLEDLVIEHWRDPFAHPELADRLLTALAPRLQSIDARLGALERFTARLAMLGTLAGLALGGVGGVVVARLILH